MLGIRVAIVGSEEEMEVSPIVDPEVGAWVRFDGVARITGHGGKTRWLEYEAYESMALKELEKIAREATDRFGVKHVVILHRVGRVDIGQRAMVVLVGAPHRGEAFSAASYIVDRVKETVPIFKKEVLDDGHHWVEGS